MLHLSLITQVRRSGVLPTVYLLTEFFNEYAAVCFVSRDKTYNCTANHADVNFKKFRLHYEFEKDLFSVCAASHFTRRPPKTNLSSSH